MEELVIAIMDAVKAQETRDRAYSECEYDADYFCHHENDRLALATLKLEKAFKQAVKECIESEANNA